MSMRYYHVTIMFYKNIFCLNISYRNILLHVGLEEAKNHKINNRVFG